MPPARSSASGPAASYVTLTFPRIDWPVSSITASTIPTSPRPKPWPADFNVPRVFQSMEVALADLPGDVVFDVAVPGGTVREVIPQLPDGSTVLIQKPIGPRPATMSTPPSGPGGDTCVT